MRNRRWSGALLLILCAMLLSACSKQPKCSGQTRSDAAAAAETTDALAVALTVVSGRYSTGFFTSDKLSVVSAAAADDGAVYLWGRNFQNEVESNWLIRYNADGTSEEYRLSLSKDGYITSLDVSAGEVYYLERVDAEDESAAWFLHTLQAQETLDWADAGNDLENLIASGALAYLTDGKTLYTCSLPEGRVLQTANTETEITTLFYRTEPSSLTAKIPATSTSWKQTARSLRKPERFRFCFAAASSCPARIQATIVWCSGKRSCSGGTSNKLPPRSCFPLIPTAWFPTTSVRLRVSETAPFWARLGKAGSCRIGCSGWNRLRKRQNREANEF